MASEDKPASTSVLAKLDAWGSSPLAPMSMATLVAALHARPIQPFALLFAPALLFASYVNVAGYAIDAAGMSAAWSGLYVLLSLRRGRFTRIGMSWVPPSQRTSTRRMDTTARRVVSAAAVGLGTVNCIAGGVKYAVTGDRVQEATERKARARWGDSN